jgi:uncharacterized protein (DUF2141 family)
LISKENQAMYNLLLALVLFSFPPQSQTGTLYLEVNNIQEAKGTLRIGIYDRSDRFPEGDAVWKGFEIPVEQKGTQLVTLPDIPFGTYAIAFHHDIDGTGKMETNFFGVPREPYAFSSGAVAKWRAPQFSEADFNFSASGTTIDATLHFWEDF